MTGCCPLIDGKSGGGPTPPPAPTCANTVLVQSLADFPAPVGTEIPLAADTLYRVCGAVDVGSLTLNLPASSVLAGEDPLVDSVRSTIAGPAVLLEAGGTVRDLTVAQIFPIRPATGSAIQIGAAVAAVSNAVIWNVSLRGEEAAVQILGSCQMISIARLLSMGSPVAVRIGDAASPTDVLNLSIDQVAAGNAGSQLVGIAVEPTAAVNSMSFSLSVVQSSQLSDFGIRTAANWLITTLRVSSCAFFGPGTPSQISQGPPFGFGTTGTARNSEAVGCVGFDNSRTRAGAQIVNAVTPNTGALEPVGTPAGPTYTLAPGSSRFILDGVTGPTQSLQYIGFAPCDVNVTAYLSVQVAAGFALSSRIVIAAIFIDRNDGLGFVQVGPPFAATTPNFTTAAPCFLAVSEGITVQEDDKLQLRLLNTTDPDPLQVLAARIVVGEE